MMVVLQQRCFGGDIASVVVENAALSRYCNAGGVARGDVVC